jgi:hypothetical protein
MYYWYPPRLTTKAGKELNNAARLARSDIHKKRIQIEALSHDALMNYVLMHQQMNKGQFEKAANSWRKMRQICDSFNSGDFPLVDPYALVRLYIDWNKGSAQGRPNYTEYAAERVSGANELVAMLPDIWLTQPDPMDIGEEQQWYSPDVFSKLDWVERSTHTSIRNQGFHNYNGSMWYRCEVDVPKRLDSRTTKLYFLGRNKYSTVWVNGIKLGKRPRRHPWEFDVSEQIIAGQKNLITVQASYDGYGHGIYRPAFLWSPKK